MKGHTQRLTVIVNEAARKLKELGQGVTYAKSIRNYASVVTVTQPIVNLSNGIFTYYASGEAGVAGSSRSIFNIW